MKYYIEVQVYTDDFTQPPEMFDKKVFIESSLKTSEIAQHLADIASDLNNSFAIAQTMRNKCNCDRRDLMTYGCKCGGI